MKKNLLLISLVAMAISCQKNEELGKQTALEKIDGRYANTPGSNSNQICDKIYISNFNQSLTIKDQTFYYPVNLFDLSALPKDNNGNSILLANCIDNSTATAFQLEAHRRNDSLMNMAHEIFIKLTFGTPWQPPIAAYTMQEFRSAMDNTPWPDGNDGSDYVSKIFNNTICKNPAIVKLPGISTFLLLPALIQNNNFDEITLEQAINYTNQAEAFVIAICNYSPGQYYTTVIDNRYFLHQCECDNPEKVFVRQGPGFENKVRLSAFYDYNSPGSTRFFMFARS